MASNQRPGERFQPRVKHKLLPRSVFFPFDTEDEARRYGSQLEELLKQSIVPQQLLAKPESADDQIQGCLKNRIGTVHRQQYFSITISLHGRHFQ
ncbi:MAG TPA: hypothetical protein PLO14_02755 [Accumulibacter sp.]|uniref:hypothetical protein n=1 Tax=Accumulibacter sp. TaxID=2053492 RepID=UPI0025CB9CFA|nr:hypothetical protein [Accumulibacter sp.]MCM8597910.1 hypothetical protein [Accumulibacter sp.]MCM8661764.1 hypothetical protein [Accumulibacter sp.]HNC51149.1 hypothetical protein [Accumulibacter sp.]